MKFRSDTVTIPLRDDTGPKPPMDLPCKRLDVFCYHRPHLQHGWNRARRWVVSHYETGKMLMTVNNEDVARDVCEAAERIMQDAGKAKAEDIVSCGRMMRFMLAGDREDFAYRVVTYGVAEADER